MVEKILSFVVVDRLHADAILVTDILKAFQAIIDLESHVSTLKEHGEVVPLGASRVEENFAADIAATVKLTSGAQALVRARLHGTLSPGTMGFVEGIAEDADSLQIARTLCTVQDGQMSVEICNELVVKENAQVAVVAVVPVSALLLERTCY
ncbi:hypothetical protein PHMEG_0005970 [Phytophthora megakarya]|uniref:Uncharacterized protein n=1 Tax=Phytophthora megakarya TaxID=4795 RepID=A0A225WQ17_9STRA|nr:hypothetical protein PHMEG_0005970 [Phytophthora megakarya]